MKKSLLKAGLLSVAGAMLVVGLVFALRGEAQARPNYMKEFTGKYPNVTAAAEAKCGVCHGAEKKDRNDYGKAFGAALPAPKCSDSAKVQEALTKAEAGKSASGKTFGELLKEGKLPK
ncbi:MAG: hypothetical protein JNM18_14510 [Planctomycetaceae bacterium]|nr:hypothetical protein [Planctomycetaceae bacterium]